MPRPTAATRERSLDAGPSDAALSEGGPLHVIEPGGARYDAATYPLADAAPRRLWLREGGRLTSDAPSAEEPTDSIAYLPLGPACARVDSAVRHEGLGADDCLRPVRGRPAP